MDFLQMKYFCAVAELENMTEASKKLFVPQPTLSVSLAKLEQELGTRLFDRYNNRIVLNHAGKVFYERSLELLRTQSNILREMGELAAAPEKRVTLVSTVQRLSAEVIHRFLLDHRDYRFTQLLRDPQSMINLLKHGEADLALTSKLEHLSSQFHYQALTTERIYVAMRKDHPLAQRVSLTMPELAEEPFCVLRAAQSTAGELEMYFQDMGRDPEIVLAASEIQLVLSAVAMGLGITLVSSAGIVGTELEQYRDTLHYVPLESGHEPRSIGLLWMRSHYFTGPQQDFLDFCGDYLGSTQRPPVIGEL